MGLRRHAALSWPTASVSFVRVPAPKRLQLAIAIDAQRTPKAKPQHAPPPGNCQSALFDAPRHKASVVDNRVWDKALPAFASADPGGPALRVMQSKHQR